MTTLFCSTDLAHRIESAEARFIVAANEAARDRGAAARVQPIAGGFACFAEDGSPLNKVVGLGFGGVPDAGVLDAIEQSYFDSGAPTQVELSNLGDPDVAALLTGRGYRLVGFENLLAAALPVGQAVSAGIEVRPAAPDELDAWIDVIVDGFAHPDGEGVASHEEFPRDILERAERDIERAGAKAYVARVHGALAGGGGIRLSDGIAQLCGAATAPSYRRLGVQSALLAVRLRDAADAGCDIAVVTTAPGSTSQKNVQRKGFHLLYTRAVLLKDAR